MEIAKYTRQTNGTMESDKYAETLTIPAHTFSGFITILKGQKHRVTPEGIEQVSQNDVWIDINK